MQKEKNKILSLLGLVAHTPITQLSALRSFGKGYGMRTMVGNMSEYQLGLLSKTISQNQ